MNAYQPYPAYKDSGVEWLDQIPAHWDVRRLKIAIKTAINGIWGDVPQENNDDLICVRVADFNYDMLGVSTDNLTIRNIPASKQSYRILSNQDLLIEKSGGGDIWPVGRLVSYNLDIKAVCSNFIARLSVNGEISSRFICYVFASTYSIGLNTRSIKQTTGIQNLDLQAYLNEKIAFPPYSEQQSIAAFLDRETAQIDTLITHKRELIDLLHRQRTAVISHAVTKGLDANVPMKDSGVEWLGEIPAHWDTWKISHIFKTIGSGTTPPTSNQEFYNGQNNWVTTSELRDNLIFETKKKITQEAIDNFSALKIYSPDTLLIALYGATIGRIGLLKTNAAINQACCALGNPRNLIINFAFYCLYASRNWIINLSYGGGQPNISQEIIRKLKLPVPSIDEQGAIAEYLNCETVRIDHLITEIEASIDLLRQQRTALISAAVTGRIDVRGQA
jgi:type I restriction enzyme, S subunit